MNLANPAWLIAWVVLPILAILAVLLAHFKAQPWEQLTAERLRGRLIKNDHPLPRWLALGFLLAAMAIFIFALARPQGDAGVKTEKTEGRNVMIALDLSRSMRVTDVNPDRLGQGKVLIYEILEVLKSDRVSLVGFAGTPYLFAPLTIDHGALKETVEQIDEEWVTMGGSDISAAIKLSTATLKETGQKNNLLILISDGEENEGDLDAIIADAESAGVRIFSIGVGTEDGGFVPHKEFSGGFLLEDNSKVLSRLQPDVLKNLATSTGGRYVVAGSAGDIPALIEVAVQSMDIFEMEAGETKILIEFFQWAVLPGILFLMAAIIAGTRWSRVSMAVILVSWFMYPADMQAKDIRGAKTAFAEGRFHEARDTYRSLANEKEGNAAAKFRLGEGLSAYEAQDLRGARSAYSEALLSTEDQVVSEAHEGLGNTLFQMGWMGISGSRYPKGKAVPDMEKFDELVREQLQKMSEEKVPEKGETNGFTRIEAVMINWTDAVRHYRSSLEKNPKDDKPLKNSEMTMAYLKRLAELLEEEKKQTAEEMMQQQQPGEGEPKEGEGQPNEGEGSEGEPNKDGKGEPKPDGKGENPDGKDKPEDKGDKPEDGKEGDKPEESDADPNETPEEEARRKLNENCDLEKGPLSSGRRQHRMPKKDW